MKINYFKELKEIFSKIEVIDGMGRTMPFNKVILKIISLLKTLNKKENKVILIGNGGSASIASHIATDLLKNSGIPATAFNDSALLTCLSNDLGYSCVFAKPIQMLSRKDDILFSISSSGRSKNILDATKEAKRQGCVVITLSGFDRDNPLRKLGDINFYIPSQSYGYVEITHLAICHLIVDYIKENG